MIDEREVERWLDRGSRFFRAVTKNSVIRSGLLTRGLTNAELEIGWGLYGSVIGINRNGDPTVPAPTNTAQQAMDELDAWDAPNFNTSKAVMSSRTPNAMTFLFSQLSAAQGPAAVVAVKTFLNRRDALKSGDAPGVSAEEGQRAVQLLAERAIVDDAKATELRALIDVAEGGATPVVSNDPVPFDEHTFQLYRAWLHEWREVARTTFTRRDYLIALGLASRRSGGGSNGSPGGEPNDDGGVDDEPGET